MAACEEYLTTPEAADVLRIAPRTLSQWAYERRGPAYIKSGRRRLYRRSDLDAWAEAQIVEHQAS